MKSLVIVAALVAFVCAHEHQAKTRESFETKRDEIREKWAAMSEGERQVIRDQHRQRQPHHESPRKFRQIPEDVRQKMHEKFESMSPEERQIFKDKMKARFEKLSDEDKQKIQEIREKLIAMPEEERKQEIQKLRNEHLVKLPHRVPFEGMPEDVRQRMHERFESLSPEERQSLFERLHRQRFPEGSRAASSPISDEEKQSIRRKFESLTPEQREEVRNQIHARPRPLPVGARPINPVGLRPSPAGEGFQPIRKPTDDIMLSRQEWIHEMAMNKQKDQQE